MTAIDFLSAIGGAKSIATLDAFAHAVWQDWSRQALTDDQAQALAETIAARKREVRGIDIVAQRAPQVAAQAKGQGRPSHFPPRRKAPQSPDRRASIKRRRLLAASGPMPPTLSCQFTTGELAVLRLVADDVRDRRHCSMTMGEAAARAGVGVTTARNAIHAAARLGLVTIQERRRDKRPNLSNIVRIVSREWLTWIERGRKARGPEGQKTSTLSSKGGGSKKMESTDKGSFRTFHGDRALRGQHHKRVPRRPRQGGPFGT